jgi:hypothetical protein
MLAQQGGQDRIKLRIVADRAGLDGLEMPQHFEDVEHVLELSVDPVRRMIGDAVDEGQSGRTGDRPGLFEAQENQRESDRQHHRHEKRRDRGLIPDPNTHTPAFPSPRPQSYPGFPSCQKSTRAGEGLTAGAQAHRVSADFLPPMIPTGMKPSAVMAGVVPAIPM